MKKAIPDNAIRCCMCFDFGSLNGECRRKNAKNAKAFRAVPTAHSLVREVIFLTNRVKDTQSVLVLQAKRMTGSFRYAIVEPLRLRKSMIGNSFLHLDKKWVQGGYFRSGYGYLQPFTLRKDK